MPLSREYVLSQLAKVEALWPLVNIDSCPQCALPRQPQYASFDVCYRCHEGWKRYGAALDELMPITYTTYDWRLGAGLRRLKDDGCRPDSNWAAGFGAILSAFLECHLDDQGSYDRIAAVPTTAPVIASALRRADREGWWTPELTPVASLRPGSRRQRDRPESDDRGDVPIDR